MYYGAAARLDVPASPRPQFTKFGFLTSIGAFLAYIRSGPAIAISAGREGLIEWRTKKHKKKRKAARQSAMLSTSPFSSRRANNPQTVSAVHHAYDAVVRYVEPNDWLRRLPGGRGPGSTAAPDWMILRRRSVSRALYALPRLVRRLIYPRRSCRLQSELFAKTLVEKFGRSKLSQAAEKLGLAPSWIP